jgi:hypothetical protein
MDLKGVKYNGGYLTATKTLGYYQKMSISDFEAQSSNDESHLGRNFFNSRDKLYCCCG